ncbi:MAG: BMP family ABC transporter substrate-binding protein [Candidatus Hodarchaeales archaeon]|jgi:hypothetical protein
MKRQLGILLIISFLAFSLVPIKANNSSTNAPLQNIAVILDSSEFYHSSFTSEIIEAFEEINQTYHIDFDLYQLTNYTLVSTNPYTVQYTYNGTVTNHTELTEGLIAQGQYDLIVLIGYELRRGFLDFSSFPNMNFLFYDLAGEFPDLDDSNIPENLFVTNFRENETGYLAGALAVSEFDPLPKKIGIVGTFKGDPRSRLLVAGFQSAIFRSTIEVDIEISYVDTWIDSSKIAEIGTDLNSKGVNLVFSALQANNTLELLNSYSGSNFVSIDLNKSKSVMKNSSKVLKEIFNEFNMSQGFFGGVSASYGILDQIYYGNDWTEPLANNTFSEVYLDVLQGEVTIPVDIKYASNTPSSYLVFVPFTLLILVLINKKKSLK